jgi:hypothetical protein
MNAKKKAQTQTLDGGITRRQLLKTTAGGSAAAVGLGSAATRPARGLGISAGIIAGGIAFGAGVKIGNELEDRFTDEGLQDTNQTEDRVYNIGATVASQTDWTNLRENIKDPPAKQTTFYRSAWGDAEAAAGEVLLSGGLKADAWGAWKTEVRRHYERFAFNLQQKIQKIWLGDDSAAGLLTAAILSESAGTNQVEINQTTSNDIHYPNPVDPANIQGNFSEVPVSEVYGSWPPSSGNCSGDGMLNSYSCPTSGNYLMWKQTINPTSDSDPFGLIRDEIADRTDGNPDWDIYGVTTDYNSTNGTVLLPSVVSRYGLLTSYASFNPGIDGQTELRVTHPSNQTVTIIPKWVYRDVGLDGKTIDNALGELTGSNGAGRDYFDNVLAPGISSGVIDGSDIFGPRDLIERYSTNDSKATQYAAAAAAAGAQLPADVGKQMKINHAKLESEGLTNPSDPNVPDGLWANTFINFVNSGQSVSVSDGTTITTSQYQAAYAVLTKPDGSTIERTLPGDNPLEILKVEGGSATYEDYSLNPLDGTANPTEEELRSRLSGMAATDREIQDKLDGGSLGGLLGGVSGFFGDAGRLALLVGGGIAGLLALNAVGGDGGGGTTVVDRGGD